MSLQIEELTEINGQIVVAKLTHATKKYEHLDNNTYSVAEDYDDIPDTVTVLLPGDPEIEFVNVIEVKEITGNQTLIVETLKKFQSINPNLTSNGLVVVVDFNNIYTVLASRRTRGKVTRGTGGPIPSSNS